jgi:hypothetical protein
VKGTDARKPDPLGCTGGSDRRGEYFKPVTSASLTFSLRAVMLLNMTDSEIAGQLNFCENLARLCLKTGLPRQVRKCDLIADSSLRHGGQTNGSIVVVG